MIKTLETINNLKKISLIKDYAIGGGYALNYYIEPILTYDLDIFTLMDTEEDYSALYKYFKNKRQFKNSKMALGKRFREVQENQAFREIGLS